MTHGLNSYTTNRRGVGQYKAAKDNVPPGKKWCSRCDDVKALAEFYHTSKRIYGKIIKVPLTWCKDCMRDNTKKRNARKRAERG